MKLVDFLILILEAQSQTLNRLAAMFGDDILLDLLENADDVDDESRGMEILSAFAKAEFWIPPKSAPLESAYQKLEGAVREMPLPSTLEFYLWAYPYYRFFVESALSLDTSISSEKLLPLVEEAIQQFEAWYKHLRIPAEYQRQAIQVANLPWVRFRTEALKRGGQRPISAVKSVE